MFVLFDFVLCTLGGLAGYFWATLYRPDARDQVASRAVTLASGGLG
jgi:glycopeptide antibiotics resistance protein